MLEESTNLKIVESSENHPLKIEFNVEENDYEKKLVKYNDLVIQINKTDLNKTNINKLKNTSTVDIDFFDDFIYIKEPINIYEVFLTELDIYFTLFINTCHYTSLLMDSLLNNNLII